MYWLRASIVTFNGKNQPTVSASFTTIDELKDGLKPSGENSGPHRRLILLEVCSRDVSCGSTAGRLRDGTPLTETKPLREVRRLLYQPENHNLDMSRGFFDDHFELGTRFTFSEDFRVRKLPSELQPDRAFHLQYFEPRHFRPTESVFAHDDETWTAECVRTGRDIQCHEWTVSKNMLLILSRKASFWSKPFSSDGWDAVLLTDPASTEGKVKSGDTRDLSESTPFKNGFNIATGRPTLELPPSHDPDLIDLDPNAPPPPRPRHTSMHDDLRFYFHHHYAQLFPSSPSPSPSPSPFLPLPTQASPPAALAALASLFARKLVASHYAHVLDFTSHQTASMRQRGWSLKRSTPADVAESRAVEREWGRFRCTEFIEALGAVLDALGVARGPVAGGVVGHGGGGGEGAAGGGVAAGGAFGDWGNVEGDLSYVHREFEGCRNAYDRITSGIAAFVSMKEAERQVRVATLTAYFALVLTPFAWLASFFSMSPRYLPDGDLRYAYWIASLGVVAVAFVSFQVSEQMRVAGELAALRRKVLVDWGKRGGRKGRRRRRGSAGASSDGSRERELENGGGGRVDNEGT